MAAPELRLKVTLDTSFLKGQISRLPLDFAGANVSIRPKFDRQTIANEFRLLNRYIGSKKFNITIASNLDAEIKNADRLVKALGRVQQAASSAKGGLPIGTQVLSRTKTKGGFAAAEIKALFGAAVQGGLIDDKTLASTRAQMVTALGSIGRDSIAGLLNGLKSGDADIQNAAKFLGNNLITSFKTVLGIASPSREFKKIGESAGEGFEQGLLKSIEIAEQSATRKMQRMLDRLARMALMMSGMSGPEIGRQVAQARALPSLNFGATTPRTSVSIGPSSTGRALPPGADRPGLPGTSFASQKLLLGDLLTPSMKTAIRDAANDFIDGIRQRMNEAIRQIKVEDLGRVSQRTLTGSRVAGYLPPVARFGEGRTASPYSTGRLGRDGETRAELFARREREARMRSALRGVDVMGEGGMAGKPPSSYNYAYRGARPQGAIVPYAPGGAMVYSGPSGGGGGGGTGGTGGGPGNFARRSGSSGGGFNMPQLPGSGVVRELGQEFGFAAKQVLLFGVAYKALAFLQSFPGQVSNAVSALQSFRNTLNAISPTAADAAASNQLIIDTVDKYNIPIQSAREGFTKLYASMKPAGFSGEQIGNLFLGISKASATLGLSSEKVDRVTYAFSQMASKGQLMAEEVTGQLGDVIPGALSIMAEAANMDIKTFKKAMEDGMFTGKAFEAVMSNVPIVMEKRFGKGAEGAAKTFQGALNDMQTSLTLLYEAFEPVAVGFLNAVVKPMTDGLQTITDGFNAFFTGQAAQTAGGNAFAKQLTDLKPAFDGILVNIKALIPSFQIFGGLLLNVAKFLATLAGNPITGFLLKVYTNVLLVNTAFNLLGGKILLGLIANVNAAIFRLVAFGYAINAVGIQTTGANTALAGTQLQMLLLQRNAAGAIGPVTTLLGSLLRLAGIGAIAIGITIAINNANELREAEERVARLRGEKNPVGPAGPKPILTAARSFTGASRETVQKARETQAPLLLQYRNELKALQAQLLTAQAIASTSEDNAQAAAANVKLRTAQARVDAKQIDIQKAQAILNLNPQQYKTEAERQRASAGAIAPIPEAPGTGKKPKEQSLESYYSLQDQLAKNFTQAEIDRLEAEHQHKVDLIKAEYDLKEARANSFQREALKFERRMAEITLERQGALLKASNDVLAAQGSVAGGAGGAGVSAASGSAVGAYLQGNIGPTSTGPHFDVKKVGGGYFPRSYLDQFVQVNGRPLSSGTTVPGGTFAGHQRRGSHGWDYAFGEGRHAATLTGGAKWMEGAPTQHGERRRFQLPSGEMFQFLHGKSEGMGAQPPGKVTPDRKRDIIADQKVQIEQAKQSVAVRQAEAKAIKDAEIALADFIATATPVEEQKLQNDLLKRKTELMMQGYSDSAVDQALKFAEAEYKVNFALKLNDDLQKQGERTKEDADAITKQMTEGLAAYSSALKENSIQLRDNQLAQAMTVLKDRMSMAGAITPDQELREQIRQRNPDFTPEQQEGLFQQEKLVQGAEKLKEDMRSVAGAIGSSFGEAFKGIITGSMTAQEALAGMFQSIADHFADMVAQMIAEWIKMMILKGIEAIINPMAGLGNLGGGISSGLSSGFSAGAASAIPTDAAGWGASFGTSLQFANGGIAPGGFTAFANGGMVTGPTMGLVGEGRYNEAIVPLPDGKSIPVQLAGGDGGNQIISNITVNVNNGQAQSNATGSNSSEMGRKIEGAVKQVIVGELRPGGLLASKK